MCVIMVINLLVSGLGLILVVLVFGPTISINRVIRLVFYISLSINSILSIVCV